ncbi:MAG: hypothetical protein U1A05_00030, partial [Alphaproteobacteria bacterium]|nr:hypothetical protein [Alphaproteobacteria bacterium]
MKMEKNTLTSLAMITFLMSSTAVVAMNPEEEARPNTAAGLTVQLQGTEEQNPPLATSGWSLFSLSTWFSSTSPVKEVSHTSIPSAAPAGVSGESLPTTAILSGQAKEKEGLDSFIAKSMTLDPEQLKKIWEAAEANDLEAIEIARKTI